MEHTEAADRLAAAAEALDTAMQRVVERLDAQGEFGNQLGTKIDRIVAALDCPNNAATDDPVRRQLEARVSELERANADLQTQASELKAQASELSQRAARKTLPPIMTQLLAKSGVDTVTHATIDAGMLDKTLAALSVEQRIAVKAEMARAGIIS